MLLRKILHTGKHAALFCGGVVLLSVSTGLYAESTNDRLTRLERMLDSQQLVQIITQLDQLQMEVGKMRGQLEEQQFEISRLKQQQKDMYMDIDQRLQSLSGGSGAPATQSPVNVSLSSVTAPAVSAPGTVDPGPGTQPPAVENASPVNLDMAQADYDMAFEKLKAGQYKAAGALFAKFLSKYPGHELAPNAQYWRAECYYVVREFKSAMQEFQKVIDHFPQSSKIPDARLKIGFIHYEWQEWQQARDILTGIVNNFPSSSAASLAQVRLQKMKKEGH